MTPQNYEISYQYNLCIDLVHLKQSSYPQRELYAQLRQLLMLIYVGW